MSRLKCAECPFQNYFFDTQGWLDNITELTLVGKVAGCHSMKDGQPTAADGTMAEQPDPAKQCVGHRNYVASQVSNSELQRWKDDGGR